MNLTDVLCDGAEMVNENCRICLHKTHDHYCTNERTLDKNGHPMLARIVYYVNYWGGEYCAGKFFSPVESHNAKITGGGSRPVD